jgi:hypothetical protein
LEALLLKGKIIPKTLSYSVHKKKKKSLVPGGEKKGTNFM